MFEIVAKGGGWTITDGFQSWEFPTLTQARAALRTVVKHGNHDQSSHGRRGGSKHAAFTVIEDDNELPLTADYVVHTEAGNISVRFEERTYELSDEMKQDVFQTVADLQTRYPRPKARVTFDEEEVARMRDETYSEAVGFCTIGKAEITMDSGWAERWGADINGSIKGTLPSEGKTSALREVLVHEWGHAMDRRMPAERLEDLKHSSKLLTNGEPDMDAVIAAGLSRYGATNVNEYFAESFAEWFLSEGGTSSPTAKMMASKYGWDDATVQKAAFEQGDVIVAETMDASKPPRYFRKVNDKFVEVFLEQVVKGVTVKFPVEALQFIKHGNHDQSTHGRRGNGSSSSIGTPKNLNGTPTAAADGRHSWDDLVLSNDPQDDMIEMHCSFVGDRTQNQGTRLMTKEEVTDYAQGVVERAGYGKRTIATWAGEEVLHPTVIAGIAKGRTDALPPDHPFYNRPIPVLAFRKEGITQFTVVHEMAHVLAGDWTGQANDGGHSQTFLDTFKQLAKQEGFTEGHNWLTYLTGPQGDRSVFS